MPLPTGQWSIVSGGNNGILDITNVGAPGTTGALPRNIGALPVIVAGTLQLAQNSTLNIYWDLGRNPPRTLLLRRRRAKPLQGIPIQCRGPAF